RLEDILHADNAVRFRYASHAGLVEATRAKAARIAPIEREVVGRGQGDCDLRLPIVEAYRAHFARGAVRQARPVHELGRGKRGVLTLVVVVAQGGVDPQQVGELVTKIGEDCPGEVVL